MVGMLGILFMVYHFKKLNDFILETEKYGCLTAIEVQRQVQGNLMGISTRNNLL